MLEIAGVAFATLFATVSPVSVAPMFAALTAKATPAARRSMAWRGVLIATCILLVFALFGQSLLARLGISVAALRTAGGILLMLIAVDMVFARDSGAVSATDDERREAAGRDDIAVFPLATPLIAGPGAMGAAALLMASAAESIEQQVAVLLSMGAVMLVTLSMLFAATQVQRLLGVTGLAVLNRVFGVLLAALAVQFVFDGIAESGLLH